MTGFVFKSAVFATPADGIVIQNRLAMLVCADLLQIVAFSIKSCL